jgi:hypothetical protein
MVLRCGGSLLNDFGASGLTIRARLHNGGIGDGYYDHPVYFVVDIITSTEACVMRLFLLGATV